MSGAFEEIVFLNTVRVLTYQTKGLSLNFNKKFLNCFTDGVYNLNINRGIRFSKIISFFSLYIMVSIYEIKEQGAVMCSGLGDTP